MKYKVGAAFFVMNVFLFLILGGISFVHFSQYGFVHAETGIQYSSQKEMAEAAIACSMGRLTVFRLVSGVMGCNMILLLTVLVSMVSRTSLVSLGTAFLLTWLFHYSVVHLLIQNPDLDLLLTVIPVNVLDVDSLIRIIRDERSLYLILAVQLIVFSGIVALMRRLWKRKLFYRLWG